MNLLAIKQKLALAVFERSVEIFPPSVSKSIWDIYLDVALKADITKEQKRDIFESAIKLACSFRSGMCFVL